MCCPGKRRASNRSGYSSSRRHSAGEETVAELCGQFGISRKTGYKIIDRYEAYGEGGLLDLSRAPHHHPNATPTQAAERIIEEKRARPTWGPKKIVARLREIDPDVPWPSPSTASGILDRAGLVRRHKRRRRATRWGEPFADAQRPNDVWSIDFKGWFRTDDGVRIDPLTAQDAMSRYLLVCDGLERPTGPEVKARIGSGFPRVRPAPRHPHRQRAALRWCGAGKPHATVHMVGQAGDSARADRARTPRAERASGAASPNPEGRDGYAA